MRSLSDLGKTSLIAPFARPTTGHFNVVGTVSENKRGVPGLSTDFEELYRDGLSSVTDGGSGPVLSVASGPASAQLAQEVQLATP